ncbi:hypothetical protein [Canibacter zhoujuaniae]|uniref:hypothetical protein n=1 Tax=Canibacter zhoujuaniae TaxID=2708343 RepID=UPI0014214DC4|nr:hypothetical protein [Canibacter zhoujuaniae]
MVAAIVVSLAALAVFLITGRFSLGPTARNEVTLLDGLVDTSAPRNSAANAEATECGAGDLELLPVTDKNSYGPGELPKLSLTLENTGKATCYYDVGTSQMIFEISSGAEMVWLSTHCQTEADHRLVLLKPGQKVESAPLEWQRQRSTEDTCNDDRPDAIAGGAAYHLRVGLGELPGKSSVQFLLY